MSTSKYLDDNGLLYYDGKIKARLNNKVDKEQGKGLFSGNYNDLTNKPSIPSKVSDITNDLNYQTGTEVQSAIDTAIAGITQFDFEIVQSLPQTGEKGVIYLVANSGSGTNIYDEYIWVSSSSSYEKIGTTDVDLSNYWSKSDLVSITNGEIDTIVNGQVS